MEFSSEKLLLWLDLGILRLIAWDCVDIVIDRHLGLRMNVLVCHLNFREGLFDLHILIRLLFFLIIVFAIIFMFLGFEGYLIVFWFS